MLSKEIYREHQKCSEVLFFIERDTMSRTVIVLLKEC